MLEAVVYASTIVVIALIILLVTLSFRTYRAAQADREKIEWALNELNRAVSQINSDDENEVMAGLQTLSSFKEPGIQIRAFPRLTELTHSNEPQLAAQSKAAIARLSVLATSQEAVAEQKAHNAD